MTTMAMLLIFALTALLFPMLRIHGFLMRAQVVQLEFWSRQAMDSELQVFFLKAKWVGGQRNKQNVSLF